MGVGLKSFQGNNGAIIETSRVDKGVAADELREWNLIECGEVVTDMKW